METETGTTEVTILAVATGITTGTTIADVGGTTTIAGVAMEMETTMASSFPLSVIFFGVSFPLILNYGYQFGFR